MRSAKKKEKLAIHTVARAYTDTHAQHKYTNKEREVNGGREGGREREGEEGGRGGR